MAVGEIGRKQKSEGPLSRYCQDHTVRLEIIVALATVVGVVSFRAADFSRIGDDIGLIVAVMSVN